MSALDERAAAVGRVEAEEEEEEGLSCSGLLLGSMMVLMTGGGHREWKAVSMIINIDCTSGFSPFLLGVFYKNKSHQEVALCVGLPSSCL